MKKCFRNILSIMLALALVISCLPSASVRAAEGIPYVGEWGNIQYCTECTSLSGPGGSAEVTLTDGWYAIQSDITLTGGLVISGEVHLILCDGVTLTSTISRGTPVQIPEGNSLTIYGQSAGTGKLVASAKTAAAIGNSGSFTIYSGTVEAAVTGPSTAPAIGATSGASGAVTINGGTVTASGKMGPGIGGGDGATCSGGTITINGGTVVASSGAYGAGIGSGRGNTTDTYIIINEGNVTATGGNEAAGIGGGMGAYAGNIVINGGNVKATGGTNAPGIGNGSEATRGATVTIRGGIVTATAGRKSSDTSVEAAGVGGAGGSSKGDPCASVDVSLVVLVRTAPRGAFIEKGAGTTWAVTLNNYSTAYFAPRRNHEHSVPDGDGLGFETRVTTEEELVDGLLDGKNCFLDCDITLTGEARVDDIVHLCLNGYVLNLNSYHIVIDDEGVLYIYDCQDIPHKFSEDDTGLWILDDESESVEHTVIGGVVTGGSDSKGGAFSVQPGGSLIIDGANIVGNAATTGGGAAVYALGGNITMNSGSICGNALIYDRYIGVGGGICIQPLYYEDGDILASVFRMNGGTIADNRATAYGGGIMAYYGSEIQITAGSIEGNSAGRGGAIYTAGSMRLCADEGKSISITGNTAATSEGGIAALSDENFFSGEIHVSDNSTVGKYTEDDTEYPYSQNCAVIAPINIVGPLTGSDIYLTHVSSEDYKDDMGVLTDGFTTYNPDAELGDFFHYEANRPDKYQMVLNATGTNAGELEIISAGYAINVENSTGGTISAEELAIPGETVIVEVTPDSDYTLASLKYNDGTDHDIVKNTDNQYTFTMPEHEVTLKAVWNKKPPYVPIITGTPVAPEPTLEPTPEITPEPTLEPTPEITPEPTLEPTPEITPEPTEAPAETFDKEHDILFTQASTTKKNYIKLSWNKVDGAAKYVVYGAGCNKSYKKLTETEGVTFTARKLSGAKIVPGKTYKFYIVAYDALGNKIKSKTIHYIAGNTSDKYANVETITALEKTLVLTVGEKANVGATYTMYEGKKHISKNHGAALRFISGSPEIVKVNKNGTVTAKKEGTAIIYIQDIGGMYCEVEVTVKKK